jgi:hypothetical protein
MKEHMIIRVTNNDNIICESKPISTNNGIFVDKATIIAHETGNKLKVEELFISNDKILYTFNTESSK